MCAARICTSNLDVVPACTCVRGRYFLSFAMNAILAAQCVAYRAETARVFVVSAPGPGKGNAAAPAAAKPTKAKKAE